MTPNIRDEWDRPDGPEATTQAHTPGPWSVDEAGGSDRFGYVFAPGEITPICRFQRPHREADARLIAAAPDLLEALKDMVRVFDGYQGLQCIRAKEVIAKAEGK